MTHIILSTDANILLVKESQVKINLFQIRKRTQGCCFADIIIIL